MYFVLSKQAIQLSSELTRARFQAFKFIDLSDFDSTFSAYQRQQVGIISIIETSRSHAVAFNITKALSCLKLLLPQTYACVIAALCFLIPARLVPVVEISQLVSGSVLPTAWPNN